MGLLKNLIFASILSIFLIAPLSDAGDQDVWEQCSPLINADQQVSNKWCCNLAGTWQWRNDVTSCDFDVSVDHSPNEVKIGDTVTFTASVYEDEKMEFFAIQVSENGDAVETGERGIPACNFDVNSFPQTCTMAREYTTLNQEVCYMAVFKDGRERKVTDTKCFTVGEQCSLDSASISAICGPDNRCGANEQVSMAGSGDFSVCKFFNTPHFQIDANSPSCSIEYLGGMLSGITKSNPSITSTNVLGQWKIPSALNGCQGETVTPVAAAVWDGAPGAGTQKTSANSFSGGVTFECPESEPCVLTCNGNNQVVSRTYTLNSVDYFKIVDGAGGPYGLGNLKITNANYCFSIRFPNNPTWGDCLSPTSFVSSSGLPLLVKVEKTGTMGSYTLSFTCSKSALGVGGGSSKSLSLSASPSSVPNDGTTTSTITASTSDKISNVAISFGTTLGTLSASSCTTGTNGKCTVTVKSSVAGTAVITGTAAGYKSDTANVIFAQPSVDLCQGVVCQPFTQTCADGFVASCIPACNPVNGACGSCTPDCTGHETPPPTPEPSPGPSPSPCTLTSASIGNCAGGVCEVGEEVQMSATFTGSCTTGSNTHLQIDAKSIDDTCKVEFTGGDISGITQINPSISGTTYSGTWTVSSIPLSCIGKTVHGWAAAIWDGAPGSGSKITGIVDSSPISSSPVGGSLTFSAVQTPASCTYAFFLKDVDNFDSTEKTGTYTLDEDETDYTWIIRADESSSADCPANILYSIPADTIATIGSCDAATGIYPVAGIPAIADKINSFSTTRGIKSFDAFKVYVKPTQGSSCTLAFGITAPDGTLVDPIFTVGSEDSGGIAGSCSVNGICEAGETQLSCPSDCKTVVTLEPEQIAPGKTTTVKIDLKDGRYMRGDELKLNLFIDGVIWSSSLCAISNSKLDPSSPPSGVEVTSSDRQVVVEAVCQVPKNIKVGQHILKVLPEIFS